MQGPKERVVLDTPQGNSSNHHDNLYKSRFYWPHFTSEEIELRGHKTVFSKLIWPEDHFSSWSKRKAHTSKRAPLGWLIFHPKSQFDTSLQKLSMYFP